VLFLFADAKKMKEYERQKKKHEVILMILFLT